MDQQEARQRLEEMERELLADVEAVRGRLDPAIGDPVTQGPSDPVDHAGNEMVLSEEDALADGQRRRLEGVRDALKRLDAGTYGTCQVCGQPIAPERLEARPDAGRCITHASAA